jgi:tetratricopeptide (TPR) repeat protein
MFGARTEVDSARYVVLSSGYGASGSSNVGAQVADSIYDALAKWEGLPVVAETRVAQAIADGATAPRTEGDALSLARRLGAGKAAWVHATGNANSPRIRVHLYDARSGEAIEDFAVQPGSRGPEFYSGAVLQLLGLARRPNAAAGCDDRTRSYHAWRACNEGHISLAAWDVAGAEGDFREAVKADGVYDPARVWLAQVIAWRTPEKRNESHDLVRGAKEVGLASRDSLAAIGLAALLDQRFPDACSAYSRLTSRDSLDFLGWYGLGECQAFDSTVVRSESSPSRWAFRTSWHSAVKNYLTALRIDPGAHAILAPSKLQGLLPLASTLMRRGYGTAPERAQFAAFPTLDRGDTVGFVPYLARDFANVRRTPAADAALRRNVTLLYNYAAGAADRFPASARAQEALAHALEARAELGAGPARSAGAMRAIDSAITLVTRSSDAEEKRDAVARLRVRKVRVHFKRGEFAAARRLADTLLAGSGTSALSEELFWVAALTGRADQAAHHYQPYLTERSVRGGTLPPSVAVPASRYFMYAALGVCGASLTSARGELETALRDYITDDIRRTLTTDLAARPAFLSASCTNGRSVLPLSTDVDRVVLAHQAFARGDGKRARDLLIATADEQRGQRTGDLSPEYVFQQAWLRAQLGDTAAAESAIDAALGALPTFSAATLKDPAGAAAFGRLMVLRAEVAAKRGDQRIARKWSAAVSDLWASSDPALKRVVGELRTLTAK